MIGTVITSSVVWVLAQDASIPSVQLSIFISMSHVCTFVYNCVHCKVLK